VEASNIEAVLRSPPHWSQDGASFWMLDAFNDGNAWIGQYEGESPWEICGLHAGAAGWHPNGAGDRRRGSGAPARGLASPGVPRSSEVGRGDFWPYRTSRGAGKARRVECPRIGQQGIFMARLGPGFVVLYRWRLHPEAEASFVRAWSRISELLLERCGSLGSRLHRGSDGLWYSYAQWPSAEARSKAFAAGPLDAEASSQMRVAIAEEFPEVILESCADFLVASYAGT